MLNCSSSRVFTYLDTVFFRTFKTSSGGVTQWLGRQSSACGLSLIYVGSMVDMRPLRG